MAKRARIESSPVVAPPGSAPSSAPREENKYEALDGCITITPPGAKPYQQIVVTLKLSPKKTTILEDQPVTVIWNKDILCVKELQDNELRFRIPLGT